MIEVKHNTKIYIVTASSHFTGGPLLLHQLGGLLKQKGFDVFMHYIPYNLNPVHPEFSNYNIPYVDTIEDSEKHILIIPEVNFLEFRNTKNIRKVLWWLSVDNYFKTFKNASKKRQLYNWILGYHRIYRKAHLHLAQSQYALDFLKTKGISGIYLSDYLNDIFLVENVSQQNQLRRDQILYNPKKGFSITKQLMDTAPELNWIALTKMSPQEMRKAMLMSKVYIDFGDHPGKDRIPREATICGCCLVVGRKGSAANESDIPISKEFKFDESNPQQIIDKIKYILAKYDNITLLFDDYRTKIRNEKIEFEKQIDQIFIKHQ